MSESRTYVGIDVGMGAHQVCLQTANGDGEEWSMKHRHQAFWALQSRLVKATCGRLERVVVGVEGHNGHLCPLDQYLLQWGCEVKNVDARKLKAFRETFGVPCKTDVKDAQLMVHLLQQPQLLKQGKTPYHTVHRVSADRRKLKKWARYQKSLIEEKTRLLNRLTKWVHEVSPELLDVGKLKGTRMLRLLKRYPNVRGLKRVTLKGLQRIKQIGPKTARQYHGALQDLEFDAQMVEVYTPMIEQTASRILQLQRQIDELENKLKGLAESVEEVGYLMSIDGCGLKLASRLMGEIGRVEWFDSHNELAAYLGVACVDHQSGDVDAARPIYPANSLGKESMMQLASLMIHRDAESRNHYDKKRAEGKNHNDAVRRVARQLVKILYRMLMEKREYVPYDQYQKEGMAA